MYKLATGPDLDHQQEHVFAPIYRREIMHEGTERIVAGSPRGDPALFRSLVHGLRGPYLVLYLLHTTRGQAELGRYQSPEFDGSEFDAFMDRFGAFLSGDGRHDVWAFSRDDAGTIVWDRHNLIYAYGPLDIIEATLGERGFGPGHADANFSHIHYYRAEFDDDADALLAAYDWRLTPLRPQDEQVPAG